MQPELEVTFGAIAEHVPRARDAITCLCDDLGIGGGLRDRIRQATTEACANCVQHAYPGSDAGEPTFGLDAHVEDEELVVAVHDASAGMSGSPLSHDHGRGMPLIDLVTDSAQVSSRAGQGTRIAMRWEMPRVLRAL